MLYDLHKDIYEMGYIGICFALIESAYAERDYDFFNSKLYKDIISCYPYMKQYEKQIKEKYDDFYDLFEGIEL